MSALETVLTRAMSDSEFADQLFADTEKAVAGYDLTAEELASLKTMSYADFAKFSVASPEERKSMSIHFLSHSSHTSMSEAAEALKAVAQK